MYRSSFWPFPWFGPSLPDKLIRLTYDYCNNNVGIQGHRRAESKGPFNNNRLRRLNIFINMKTLKQITRKDYMDNSSELHHAFYSQFITESTNRFILNSLTVEDIKKALEDGDEHLNEIKIPYNHMGRGGRWWWDDAPINVGLLKELGVCASPSTFTCVAKAAARILAEQSKEA